jgi:hypothetical protein
MSPSSTSSNFSIIGIAAPHSGTAVIFRGSIHIIARRSCQIIAMPEKLADEPRKKGPAAWSSRPASIHTPIHNLYMAGLGKKPVQVLST